VDCEPLDVFCRVKEGWETVSWRRNRRQRVEFCNASISVRREEGKMHVSEGERNTHGNSWFPHGGATGGCSDAAACGGGQQQSRTAPGLTRCGDNQSSILGQKVVWAEYCCGDQIGHRNRIGWERKILGPKENCG
jgi:hypothetical protein